MIILSIWDGAETERHVFNSVTGVKRTQSYLIGYYNDDRSLSLAAVTETSHRPPLALHGNVKSRL